MISFLHLLDLITSANTSSSSLSRQTFSEVAVNNLAQHAKIFLVMKEKDQQFCLVPNGVIL